MELTIQTSYSPPASTNVELIIDLGVVTYSITIVEGMTLVSSPAKQLSGVQQIALTLTLAEDLQKVLPLFVSNTDNITLNESLLKKKLVRKLLSEIITLTEDLAKQGVLNLPLSELLFLDEDTTTAGDFKSGLVDNVTLVEAIFYIKQLNSILKESININEVTAFTSLINKILSDLVNLIENVDLKSGSRQHIVDTLSLSEERRLNLLSALVDSVVLQELLTKVYTAFIQNIEDIHLSEKTERRIGISYSEAITLLDTIIKELKIILYDNIALNEFITYHLTASLLTEIMLNEAQQGSAYLTEQILDTLGLSDQIDVIHQLLTISGEYNLVSLILTAKLLNSDIGAIIKLYSLIKEAEDINSDIINVINKFSLIKKEEDI